MGRRFQSIADASTAEFKNSLTRWLGVPPDEADQVSADVLGGKLRCPLGGELVLSPVAGWQSTAWVDDRNQQLAKPPVFPPANYKSPVLTWFRGIEGKLVQKPNRVTADLTLQVARLKQASQRNQLAPANESGSP